MQHMAGKIAIALLVGSLIFTAAVGVIAGALGADYEPYAKVELRALANIDSRPPECFAANPLLQPDSDVEFLVDGNVVATTKVGVGRRHGPYCIFDVGANVPNVDTVTVRVAKQTFTVNTKGSAPTVTATTDPYDAFGLTRRT